METVAEVLATGFLEAGHEVSLVTTTSLADKDEAHWPFVVYRKPDLASYLKLLHRADIVLHNCISLKHVLPDWLYRHKVFVIHHTWYRSKTGSIDVPSRIKRIMSRLVHNVFISKAIKDNLQIKGKVIPNPYNDFVFNKSNYYEPTKELVFLGRLVSDKGVYILLEALKLAKQLRPNFKPKLTIIGNGPEKQTLEKYAALYLPEQVSFAGELKGAALATALNDHKILVVPSLWEEPFGVVALEGLACGCLVIGSEQGGLKNAIGPCGWTFPNGNVEALADLLFEVWTHKETWANKYAAVEAHLYRHQPAQIVQAYLNYFNSCV